MSCWQIETALYDKESVIRKLRSGIRTVADEKNATAAQLEHKTADLQGIKLQTERGKVELDLLKAEVEQKFGTGFELSLQDQFRSFDLSDLEKEVTKSFLKVEQLRTRLANDGEIDRAVVEQYAIEKERLLTLEEQLVDFEGAQKSLERSIRHLRELSRQKFVKHLKMFLSALEN